VTLYQQFLWEVQSAKQVIEFVTTARQTQRQLKAKY